MADLKVEVPENSQSFHGTTIIKAPLAKVFEAHVNIELYKQWWARGHEMDVKEFNAVDGGVWHVVEKAEDGDYEFFGVFHEVAKNERIVATFELLGMGDRGDVNLERQDFRAIDDTTTEIKSTSVCPSVEARAAMIEYGMEEGWRDAINALGKLLEK